MSGGVCLRFRERLFLLRSALGGAGDSLTAMTLEEAMLKAHPLYPLPTRGELESDYERTQTYLRERGRLICLEEADPWRYGYLPEVWKLPDAAFAAGKREVLILGGNRATKSFYAAHKAVAVLLSGPKKTVWCLQTTYKNSVEMQQPILFHYLPAEFKNLPRSRIANVSYTQKTGFSDGKFVLPNGSECIFRNYSQKIEVVEGGDCDLIWCDEMCPVAWIETLRYRILSRKGLLLLTFTPVQMWSPVVAEYLENAKTVQYAEAPLLPAGVRGRVNRKVPRVQQPSRANACVVYFHITDNPFTSSEVTAETLEGAPVEEILMRAYGVPSKGSTNRFPRFREDVHVLAAAEVARRIEGATCYHFVDPASGRNWFMLWVAVLADSTHIVYREWPDLEHHGEWASPDSRLADGRAGPAQDSYGWGIQRYLDEISELEKLPKQLSDGTTHEQISERWIDSVYANMPTQTREGGTTLLEELQFCGSNFLPSPREHIDEGVSLINNLLDYERGEDNEIRAKPKLYFSEKCANTIFSVKIWTGKEQRMGASKDPIDCLRFMVTARLVAFKPEDLVVFGGGHY